MNVPNSAAGGRLGVPIFEATCGCTFVSNYPYGIGPRLGVAYQLDSKTVFRGGWGFVYGYPTDLTLQNTANITNSATGVNGYLPLNTTGTVPQPAWPNFSAGQTPCPAQPPADFSLSSIRTLRAFRARINGASEFSAKLRRIL